MASQDEIRRLEEQTAQAEQASIQAKQDLTNAEAKLVKSEKELTKFVSDLVKSGQFTLNEGQNLAKTVKALKDLYEQKLKKEKIASQVVDELTKAERDVLKAKQKQAKVAQDHATELQRQITEAKKPSGIAAFFEKVTDTLAGGKSTGKDSFEEMYRARQRFSGLEQILTGNFKSGLIQVAGSFTNLTRIMNGPYVAALTTVISTLNAFDKYITGKNMAAFSSTGGYLSPYRDASTSEILDFNQRNKRALNELGMSKQEEQIRSSLIQNFSTQSRQLNWDDLLKSFSYGRKSFESLGIDSTTSDRIMSNLIKNEGLSANQSLAFIRRMQSSIASNKGTMSDKQIIDETMKGYDANKKFNLSMEWVNRQILKFNSALENGTRTAESFASVQKNLYEGESGQLAGWGTAMIENALSNGVYVPKELMENMYDSRALSEAMKDPEVMKEMGPMYKSFFENQNSAIGGESVYLKRFAARQLLKAQNFNLSTGDINALAANNFDFVKTGLLGTGYSRSISTRPELQSSINEEALNFQNDMKEYTNRIRTAAEQISNSLDEMKDTAMKQLVTQQETKEAITQSSINIIESDASFWNKFMASASIAGANMTPS